MGGKGMNSQKTSQHGAAQGATNRQTAAEKRPAGKQEADAHGDAHAMNQAARSVMHPEHHEPEWRFYHGAMHG
jgi:hypothetical protein